MDRITLFTESEMNLIRDSQHIYQLILDLDRPRTLVADIAFFEIFSIKIIEEARERNFETAGNIEALKILLGSVRNEIWIKARRANLDLTSKTIESRINDFCLISLEIVNPGDFFEALEWLYFNEKIPTKILETSKKIVETFYEGLVFFSQIYLMSSNLRLYDGSNQYLNHAAASLEKLDISPKETTTKDAIANLNILPQRWESYVFEENRETVLKILEYLLKNNVASLNSDYTYGGASRGTNSTKWILSITIDILADQAKLKVGASKAERAKLVKELFVLDSLSTTAYYNALDSSSNRTEIDRIKNIINGEAK